LAEFLKFEFCADVEDSNDIDAGDWVARARAVKTADHEFFTRDPQFVRRLLAAIPQLDLRACRSIHHWAQHHLPA